MNAKVAVLGGAVVVLLLGGALGSVVVDDDAPSDREDAAATTTTLPEVPEAPIFLTPEETTPTTGESATSTVPAAPAPVSPPTSAAAPATTSTTRAPAGVGASSNTAPCPGQPQQPGAGAPVPAAGVSTVALSGAVRAVSTSGRQPAWRPGLPEVLRVETASGKDPGLCASAPDGSAQRGVATPAAADDPVLSHDGSSVAIRTGVGSGRVRLVVGPVDASTRTAVLDGADVKDASWLGNGTVVACFTPTGGGARLVKVPAAGGPPTKLRDGCFAPASGSPDGRNVAVASPTGMDVIDGAGTVTTLDRPGLVPHPPAWSPDGNRLAFAYTDGDGQRSLDVFDLGKQLATRILRAEADRPAFSPAGDRIAFTGVETAGGPRRVRTVGAGGGTVTNVATCAGLCLLPRNAWSSDGTAVVLSSTSA